MTNLDPISRLSRDLKQAAATLSPNEARYFVDAYYQIQEYRKASANQIRALTKANEPHLTILWLEEQTRILESQIQRLLDTWSDTLPNGVWAKSVCGIGPVIAAGLLAHIDIKKAPTVGHIWRFAGLDPTVTWEKGKKRPWNASLKTLCWKIGESFVKVSGNEKDFYGHLWTTRKRLEWDHNLRGDFQSEAKRMLSKDFGKDKIALVWYKGLLDPSTVRQMMDEGADLSSAGACLVPLAPEGKGVPMLPPAHIHSRSKRWVVKLFLAHYHEVAFWNEFGTPPPKPYVIEHLGHVDKLNPPNWTPPGV